MHGLKFSQKLLHARTQCGEGGHRTGKERITPNRRKLLRVQRRQVAGGLSESDISVPTDPTEEPIAFWLFQHLQHFRRFIDRNHTIVGVMHKEGSELANKTPQCPR